MTYNKSTNSSDNSRQIATSFTKEPGPNSLNTKNDLDISVLLTKGKGIEDTPEGMNNLARAIVKRGMELHYKQHKACKFIDPKSDSVFKSIFSKVAYAIPALNALLNRPEGKKIISAEPLNSEISQHFYADGRAKEGISSSVDLPFKVKAQDGKYEIIILEMQQKYQDYYIARSQFYASSFIVQGPTRGGGSKYHKQILPVHVLSIVNDILYPDTKAEKLLEANIVQTIQETGEEMPCAKMPQTTFQLPNLPERCTNEDISDSSERKWQILDFIKNAAAKTTIPEGTHDIVKNMYEEVMVLTDISLTKDQKMALRVQRNVDYFTQMCEQEAARLEEEKKRQLIEEKKRLQEENKKLEAERDNNIIKTAVTTMKTLFGINQPEAVVKQCASSLTDEQYNIIARLIKENADMSAEEIAESSGLLKVLPGQEPVELVINGSDYPDFSQIPDEIIPSIGAVGAANSNEVSGASSTDSVDNADNAFEYPSPSDLLSGFNNLDLN